MRIDPTDGNAYTDQDFVDHYGPTNGPSKWATANKIPPTEWKFYHAPRNAIDMTNLLNAPQCRQQKKSKSEKCRQVVTSSFRNPGSPLIVFAPPKLGDDVRAKTMS